jgi:hypothetical protein
MKESYKLLRIQRIVIIRQLADCPQCYCGKIRQILIFHINLYCLNITEKKILCPNPTSSPRLEPKTVLRFVNFAPAFSPPKQTNNSDGIRYRKFGLNNSGKDMFSFKLLLNYISDSPKGVN